MERLNTKLLKTVGAIAVSILFVCSSLTVNALGKDFYIIDNKNTYKVMSLSNEPEKVITKAGLKLNSEDKYVVDEKTSTIIVKRAFEVDIVNKIDNTTSTITTTGGTVSDILMDENIEVKQDYYLEPSMQKTVTQDTPKIEIEKKYNLNISIDGGTINTCAKKDTSISEALKKSNVNIGENDIISVDKNQLINSDMDIQIQRVNSDQITVVEDIPFNTITKKTETLEKGTTQVEVEGETGQRVVTKAVTTVDGVVTQSEELNSETIKTPKDKVVLLGTGKKTINFANISYSSVLTGPCTGYTGGGTTATGLPAQVGRVAVNPRQIPYGTKLFIASPDGSFVYGEAVAADTGGAMMQGRALVDLYFDTKQECINFGRRTMNVYVL